MIEYELFFNYSLDMFVIAGVDGYFKRANPAFCNLLGYSEAELLARPFATWIHPDDLGKVEMAIQNLRSGHPAFLIEIRLLATKGRQVTLQWTAYPDLESGLLFAVARDVSLSYANEKQLRMLMNFSTTAVFLVAQDGTIVYTNRLAEMIFGYEEAELNGMPIETLVPKRLRHGHAKHRLEYTSNPALRPMGVLPGLSGRRKDGDEFPIEVGLNPVGLAEGIMIICSVMDTTLKNMTLANLMHERRKLEKANSRLGRLAEHDTLTGLYNRRGLERVFLSMLSAARDSRGALSVLLADIDFFKDYNDAFGHPAGDELLKNLADTLTRNVRKGDTVARAGGEEFVIILPGIEYEQAAHFGERLKKIVEQGNLSTRPVTISLGASTFRFETRRVALKRIMKKMISEADRAMYHSKSMGRNRYSHFSDLPLKEKE